MCTKRAHDGNTMLSRRRRVASASGWRYLNVVCPLGTQYELLQNVVMIRYRVIINSNYNEHELV